MSRIVAGKQPSQNVKSSDKCQDKEEEEEEAEKAELDGHLDRMQKRVAGSFMVEFTSSIVHLIWAEHRRQSAFDSMIASGHVDWSKLDFFAKQVFTLLANHILNA
jgi:hypothetical protein